MRKYNKRKFKMITKRILIWIRMKIKIINKRIHLINNNMNPKKT